MKKYVSTFKIDGDLSIENEDLSQSAHLKKRIVKALESGKSRDVKLKELQDEGQILKETPESNTNNISIILPAHPDDIKGSGGSTEKASELILESFNTSLVSISKEAHSTQIFFEYTGTVHYIVEEAKPLRHYEVYTFVANGNFGILELQHTFKNELVRCCLDALNDPATVLYEAGHHTTDYQDQLPETLSVPHFENLIIQLSIPQGQVALDGRAVAALAFEAQAQHFDINVFNTDGVFTPEKVDFDDADGVPKLIVSLYYEA